MARIGIIILAAGDSSRLGKSKQLLSIQGQPLLRRVVLAAWESNANPVVVVLGARHSAHEEVLQDIKGLQVAYNKNWENGMGSSIKCGVRYLMDDGDDLDGIIVSVCDQPLLSKEQFNLLITEHKKSPHEVVASRYESDAIGVPTLFPNLMFPLLLQIPDRKGAKTLIEEDQVKTIDFSQGDLDIDTLQDYDALLKRLE